MHFQIQTLRVPENLHSRSLEAVDTPRAVGQLEAVDIQEAGDSRPSWAIEQLEVADFLEFF